MKPLAQGVGFATWYMVKTSKGVVGWIQAEEVASTQRTDEVFRDRSKDSAKDVTPQAQRELNFIIDLKALEERRIAEERAEKERQRAAELRRQQIQEQAAAERARIEAQSRVDAEKEQKPDVCLNCNQWR